MGPTHRGGSGIWLSSFVLHRPGPGSDRHEMSPLPRVALRCKQAPATQNLRNKTRWRQSSIRPPSPFSEVDRERLGRDQPSATNPCKMAWQVPWLWRVRSLSARLDTYRLRMPRNPDSQVVAPGL